MEDDEIILLDSPPPPPPPPPHSPIAAFESPEDPKPQETEPTSAADPLSSSSSLETAVLTDELREKIIRQVEYYFSDENLPTDKFLMKYVEKDKEGFVPIVVVASFRKMKKLAIEDSLVVAALRESSQLVLSSDGKKVKRLHPMPVMEVKDPKSHTVVIENLPEDYSIETLQRIFGEVGSIKSICIRDPHATNNSSKANKSEMGISGKIHALVEYETVKAAEKAVATLNDEKNWRSGMRVELLLKRMGKYGLPKRWRGGASEKHNVSSASDKGGDEQNVGSLGDHDGHVEANHTISEKTGRKSRNQGRSKGHKQNIMKAHGHGSGLTGSGTEILNKPPPGPRMPDGTRGFTMGRGQSRPCNHN